MQPWALVSPASRGIGLELARHILRSTNLPVVATARSNLDGTKQRILDGLSEVREDRLHMLHVDVLDEQTVHDAAKTASTLFGEKKSYLHLAFCVPGILNPEKSPSQIEYEKALLTFRVNSLGPMMLLKHFSPFLPRKSTPLNPSSALPKQAVWATMSARVGSITDNRLGGWYSYRASKAAVNQMTKTFDNHLRTSAGDKAISIALHPGTVKTALSQEFWSNVKEEKLFTAEFAADKLLEVVRNRTAEHRGKCWDWKGEEIPP